MAAKLFIVNNGMKDLCGHYYETAISVADAARSFGLEPVLATHVNCQTGIVPNDLRYYPLFRTDHWINTDPAPEPDMQGMRTDLHGWRSVKIDTVLDGSKTLTDYLQARFNAAPSQIAVDTAPPPAPSRPDGKGVAKALLPPYVFRPLRWLYHKKSWAKRCSKALLMGATPPFLWDRLRRSRRLQLDNPPVVTPPPQLPTPAAMTPMQLVQSRLSRQPSCRELEYSQVFRRDLERLLCLVGFGPRDHVFFPTAHGRELFAIRSMLDVIDSQDLPTFHLEFRHALDYSTADSRPDFDHPYTIYHRIFFDAYRQLGTSPRIHLYTDTAELSAAYSEMAGIDFGVLPIPYRARLMEPREYDSKKPLTIMFFGEARDEKGFHLLPDVVEYLWRDYVQSAKVRFVFQATLVSKDRYLKSAAALDRLKNHDARYVELAATDAPLAAEDYYKLISQADLVLSPSCRYAFRARSSGTFTEALALGIPTVVPANTWLASQQPAGSGEIYAADADFPQAVQRVCDNYSAYLTKARAARTAWLATHSPERLVEALLSR